MRVSIILLLIVALCGVLVITAEENHDDDHEDHVIATEEDHDDDHEDHVIATGEDHDDDHEDHVIAIEKDHDDDHEDHAEIAHGDADHEAESAAGVVELSAASIRAAGIQVTTLTPELLPELISAPGEIQLNQYRSAEVTSLIDAVVIKRHARLGDEVETGAPLVTLTSIEVAAAQGELMIRSTEWQRVRAPGQGSGQRQTLYRS